MSTEVLSGPLGEVRSATTAGGGTALTTTATQIVLPPGTKQIDIIPRNFTTAVVVKFNKNPWLFVMKTTDKLVTEANLTDYSGIAQNGATTPQVILNSLATFANGGALYIGSHVPFRGAIIDVNNANSNASVLTVKYRKSDNTWTTISATDGTASGGATFAVDGSVTWTVPTDWISSRLAATGDTVLPLGIAKDELFWTRWEVSAALDSSTDINGLIAINRSTTYAELPSGTTWEESVTVGPGGICSITALTDAGTANLIINCAARGRFA